MSDKTKLRERGGGAAASVEAGAGPHERTVRMRLSELRREMAEFEKGRARWLRSLGSLLRAKKR